MTLDTISTAIKGSRLSITNYALALGVGIMTLTFPITTIATEGALNLDTGTFNIYGGNLSIYGTAQLPNIVDSFAMEAPYPPASFFVPVTAARPTEVIAPEIVYGANEIYLTYYNADTQLWDDVNYELQYPDQTIPAGLKEDVADQTFLYNQYITQLALWQANYDMQTVFQWPYYWALNVVRAPGMTP